jgi:hypothetical protein
LDLLLFVRQLLDGISIQPRYLAVKTKSERRRLEMYFEWWGIETIAM